MSTDRQHNLPFDPPREQARLERVARLLSAVPNLRTAAKLFDDQAYREATVLALRDQKGTSG